MNVIDYITITCNIKTNCPITDYIRLQLITITNYDDPMSANQHQELPVFPAIYRVDTCFCFDIRIRFFNFPLPTCFYMRSPLFYIISWIIYYPKSRIIFLNFISFQWFCQLSSKLQSVMWCAQCLSWILDSNWFWFL